MEIPSMVMLPLLASVRPWIAMYVCSSYSGQKHVLSLHTIRDAAQSALSFGVKSSEKASKKLKNAQIAQKKFLFRREAHVSTTYYQGCCSKCFELWS